MNGECEHSPFTVRLFTISILDSINLTIRGQEAVQEAIGIAEKGQNQQVEPEHLLAAMLEQKEGVVKPIFGKIGAMRRRSRPN